MKELLEKWAELESDECYLNCSEDTIYVIDGMQVDVCSNFGKYELAIIQYAIQQAMEARGWDWSVLYNPKKRYRANTFYQPGLDGWCIGLHDSCPAEALLSAYLQALESVNDEVAA